MKRLLLVSVATSFAGCGGPICTSECKAYITCFEKAGGAKGSLDFHYGASGTCWQTAETAESCTVACKSGIAALKAAHPDAGC